LAVPIDEDLTCRGEDVRRAALQKKVALVMVGMEWKNGDLEKASHAEREHGQKLEGRGEDRQVVDLHQSFGLCPCEDLFN
jgi:hypothetical protein